jgi:hypothetical protein
MHDDLAPYGSPDQVRVAEVDATVPQETWQRLYCNGEAQELQGYVC